MSREKKRGTTGNARAYITRAKALKKLQLTLDEFRRLCIVKGIYPRDPRKKVDGADKTYYLRKDIDFLAHDRLIGVLRAQNAHRKKVTKARARRERDSLRQLAVSAPRAHLDHIVLERYPRFEDSLQELDDPLCVVALFANMPAVNRYGITAKKANLCRRLLNEFHHFVAETGALRKTFVSIKGYYFQAVINGVVITWLTPHRFTQVLPNDVDYKVMLTFLDLYKCILSFVNFKLYGSANLVYPPKFSRDLLNTGLELGAVVDEKHSAVEESGEKSVADEKETETVEADVKVAAVEDESDEEENDVKADESEDEAEDQAPRLDVFRGCSVVIGRETPFTELEFALKAAGVDKVTREDDLLDDVEGPERVKGYTHWICDRPSVRGTRKMEVEYVQPQFIFDSINTGMRLPTTLYGVGRKLPPHLSPFVAEDADGGYRPWYKDIVERIKAGDESVVKQAAAVMYQQEKAQKEIYMDVEEDETTKTEESKTKNKKRKRVKEQDEDENAKEKEDEEMAEAEENDSKEESENEEDDDNEDEDEKENEQSGINSDKSLSKVMLSRKKMRKYQHVLREQQNQEERKAKLTAKRQALESKAKQVVR